VDATNLLNQRSVTAFNTDITSLDPSARTQYLTIPSSDPSAVCSKGTSGSTEAPQCYIANSSFFYAAVMRPYNVQALMNDRRSSCGTGTCVSSAVNTAYGKPYYFQLARNIRLGLKFTF
jgi:hypothetical protein